MINQGVLKWLLQCTFVIIFVLHVLWKMQSADVFDLLAGDYVTWAKFAWGPATSAVSAVGLFYFAFTKYLWRWVLFKKWLVIIPDLTGTWLARSVSETFDNIPYYSIVYIDHQLHLLTYRAYRPQSDLESDVCVLRRQDQAVKLYVFYGSEVGTRPAVGAANHDGCLKVRLMNEPDPKNWRLRGIYWTNKNRIPAGTTDRGTTGTIELSWECRAFIGEDSALAESFFQEEERAIEEYRRRLPLASV